MALSIVVGLLGVFPMVAAAVELTVPITGTVTDALGTALPGAKVQDGAGQQVTTDALGRYTINEPAGGSFNLTASKPTKYVARTKPGTGLPGQTIDFALNFVITTSASPVYFNSAPTSVSLSLSSAAPTNSVATATVAGQAVPMALASTDGSGVSTWTATYTAGASDAIFTATFSHTNGGVSLGSATSRQFVLDRVAPTFANPRVSPSLPTDALSTYAQFPTLSVTVSDDRSGVKASTARFVITPPDGAPATTVTPSLSGGQLRYVFNSPVREGTWTWAYSVSDNAGNEASGSTAFYVRPYAPVIDLRPVVAGLGEPVQFRAIVPVPSDPVVLRLTGPTGVSVDFPMTRNDRRYEVTVPATALTAGGIFNYRVVATSDFGDILSERYTLGVGQRTNLVPATATNVPSLVALTPYGNDGGRINFVEGDESADSGPTAAAVDPNLNRVYVVDAGHTGVDGAVSPQLNVRDSRTGLEIARYSLASVTNPTDVAVNPATGDIYVLDPVSRAVLWLSSSGSEKGRLTLPRCSLQPAIPDPDGLAMVPNGTGGYTLNVVEAGGDYVPVDAQLPLACTTDGHSVNALPGLRLADGVFAQTGVANGQPVLGIVDVSTGTTQTLGLPLPPPPPGVPDPWLLDAVYEPMVTSYTSTAGVASMQLVVATALFQNRTDGTIPPTEYQVVGVSISVNAATRTVNVGAAVAMEMNLSQRSTVSRVFMSSPLTAGFYDLETTATDVRIHKNSFTTI